MIESKLFENLSFEKKDDDFDISVTNHLFFFANPRSGSQSALKYLEIPEIDFYVNTED